MSGVKLSRESAATPAKSVPNYIQDTKFFSSVCCHTLREAGGWEFVGLYQAIISTCLSDTDYLSQLEAGNYTLLAKVLGVKVPKLEAIFSIISKFDLAEGNEAGVILHPQRTRAEQYSRLSQTNSINRTGSSRKAGTPPPADENQANPSITKEIEKGIVQRSGNDSNCTLPTTTTSTTATALIPSGGSKGGRALTADEVLATIDEIELDSIKSFFLANGLNLDLDLRNAATFVGSWARGKSPKNLGHHITNWAAEKAGKLKQNTGNGPPKRKTKFQEDMEILRDNLNRPSIFKEIL